MMGKKLVKWVGCSDQHSKCGIVPAPRASRLLNRACDGARVTDKQRRSQSADIDSQFEGVGRHDHFDRTVAKSLLDFAPLAWKITGAVTSNFIHSCTAGLLQVFQ